MDGNPRRRPQIWKTDMNFGTWNVQSCRGKMEDIIGEIEKLDLDCVVLSETKKKGSGLELCGKYIHIYSGVPKNVRASKGVSILIKAKFKSKITNWESVNERTVAMNVNLLGHRVTVIGTYAPTDESTPLEKDQYFEALGDLINDIGDHREVILMGDLNGRTGRKIDSQVIGKYGENRINDNGERLITICSQNKLKIMNGFFQHKDIHKYTWHQETRQLRSIIDYIIVRQDTKWRVQDVRVYRGIDCGSDHFLVKSKMKLPYKCGIRKQENTTKETEKVNHTRYKTHLLRESSIQLLYQRRLEQTLNGQYDKMSAKELCQHVIESIKRVASEALGEMDPRRGHKNEIWSNTLEEQKKKKQTAYNRWICTKALEDRTEYKRELAEFKRLLKKEKNEMWERKCTEINTYLGSTRSTEAWKLIKTLRSDNVDRINIPIISLNEWQRHYENELKESRPQYKTLSPTKYRVQGTQIIIITEMIEKSLKTMKNGKSSGPEGIPSELLKYGPPKLKIILAALFTKIVNGEPAPEAWKTAWITPIHKKGRKDLCNNYRGISVTDTLSRLYGKVLKNLIEEEYSPCEIEEQAGFRAGRSCVDNIFPITQIIEKKLATYNNKIHLLFVDLTKAYDTVPIKKLWEVLEESTINATLINAVKQLYKDCTSRVRVGQTLSEPFPVTKGLKQGCCLSPTLFKIYLSHALNQWRRKCKNMGIPISENLTLYTLHFADDQIVMAHDKEDLEYMTRKLLEEYERWGLEVNKNKTKYMCVGGELENLELENNMSIEACEEYTYLGVKIVNNGRCEKEIEQRLAKGKKAIGALNSILWSRDISDHRKHLIYDTILKSIMLYGSEVWQINEQQKKKLLATEMDFWRRSARVSRLDRIRNESIRQRMKVETDILQQIQDKQLCWYGHVQRMTDERIPKQVIHWVPQDKRKRGRPKCTWKQGIERAMSERNLQPGDWNDRRGWQLRTGGRRRTL